MKTIIMNMIESAKRLASLYIEAMQSYGEAINNSRGLVGA